LLSLSRCLLYISQCTSKKRHASHARAAEASARSEPASVSAAQQGKVSRKSLQGGTELSLERVGDCPRYSRVSARESMERDGRARHGVSQEFVLRSVGGSAAAREVSEQELARLKLERASRRESEWVSVSQRVARASVGECVSEGRSSSISGTSERRARVRAGSPYSSEWHGQMESAQMRAEKDCARGVALESERQALKRERQQLESERSRMRGVEWQAEAEMARLRAEMDHARESALEGERQRMRESEWQSAVEGARLRAQMDCARERESEQQRLESERQRLESERQALESERQVRESEWQSAVESARLRAEMDCARERESEQQRLESERQRLESERQALESERQVRESEWQSAVESARLRAEMDCARERESEQQRLESERQRLEENRQRRESEWQQKLESAKQRRASEFQEVLQSAKQRRASELPAEVLQSAQHWGGRGGTRQSALDRSEKQGAAGVLKGVTEKATESATESKQQSKAESSSANQRQALGTAQKSSKEQKSSMRKEKSAGSHSYRRRMPWAGGSEANASHDSVGPVHGRAQPRGKGEHAASWTEHSDNSQEQLELGLAV